MINKSKMRNRKKRKIKKGVEEKGKRWQMKVREKKLWKGKEESADILR